MNPDRTIKTTTSGRRAAAARDGRLVRGQEPTRPLMRTGDLDEPLRGLPPQPWTVDQLSQSSTVRDAIGRPIATVALRAHVSDPNVAAVLAAAPALLSACEQAEYWLAEEAVSRNRTDPSTMLCVLRGAIAQARGRS